MPVGTDRLSGTVTNRLGVPLEDAILAFGKQVYILGTLAPGATVRVELAPGPPALGLPQVRTWPSYVPDQAVERRRTSRSTGPT